MASNESPSPRYATYVVASLFTLSVSSQAGRFTGREPVRGAFDPDCRTR